MAVTNWLPKPINGNDDNGMEAPLKAIDIRDTLNHYGGKVTNDTTSYFTTDANINRWSKHKPIINGDPFLPFKSDAWDNQVGTIPKVYMHSNLQYEPALIEVWNGCSEDEWFQYELPNGSSDQPLRLGDFRGYRADATSPFKSFTSDSTEIEPTNGTATFYLNIRYYLNDENAQADGGMLSLEDIALDLNNYEYYMLLVAKFTPKNTGPTQYKAWIGSSTKTANWGELVSSIDIGMINSTNEGTYEFAVGLTDNHSNHIKLPFQHITLKAEIWHQNDYFEDMTGNAYYTEWYGTDGRTVLNNGFVDVSQVIHAGNVNTDGPVFSKQLYIGSSPDNMIGPLMGSSVTIEKGKKGTLSFYWSAADYPNTWESYKNILKDAIKNGTDIYVGSSSTNGAPIPVSGTVINNN